MKKLYYHTKLQHKQIKSFFTLSLKTIQQCHWGEQVVISLLYNLHNLLNIFIWQDFTRKQEKIQM